MRIKFLGTHNTESNTAGYVSFIIGDIIAFEAGSLTSRLNLVDQKTIKAVFISHCHYDHVKCLPSLAFNLSNSIPISGVPVYASERTQEIITSHLLDGVIYPNYSESDSYVGVKLLEFKPISESDSVKIGDYTITAFSVRHTVETFGFGITAPNGSSLFYTADTGPGLSHVWQKFSPQTVFFDTTFPNRSEHIARESEHLCPKMIERELVCFKKIKGYYPRVYLLHISPDVEDEIKLEAMVLAKKLGIPVEVPAENTTLTL